MSEAQEVEQEQEQELDIDALQAHLDGIINEEEQELESEVEIEQELESEAEVEAKFDIDAAINSGEHVSLTGKITQEEAEESAKSRGWNEDGSDKYGHKISAIEFLERASFFKKNDLLRGDVEKVKEQLGKVLEHNKQIAQKSIEKQKQMKAEFEAEKEKLLSSDFLDEDGIKRVRELDSNIADNTVTESPATDTDQIVNDYEAARDTFKADNEWYGSNRAMTALADKVGTEYAIEYEKTNGHLPKPEDFFEFVLNEVKTDFPDKQEPVRQTKVAGGNRVVTQTNKPKKKTVADLPEEMRSLAKEVMEATGLSEDEYLSTYKF
jgi:hypothetical protein